MGIADRLFNITKAWINSQTDKVSDKNTFFDRNDDFDFSESERKKYSKNLRGNSAKRSGKSYSFDPDHDLHEDLKIFNLSINATFHEVKKAYKSECKKYHSDFYQHDKEKKEVANDIMVIFNSAFDRLEKYFKQL